jgi:peptidylprolyl isomerase
LENLILLEAQNGYQPIPFQSGKKKMIPGFIEGLEKLSFGDRPFYSYPLT